MTQPGSDLGLIQIRFPAGVYADVRLERTVDHRIVIRDGELHDVLSRTEVGALLRVLKDGRWYFASTTDLGRIDAQLAELSASTALAPGEPLDMAQILQIHVADCRSFTDEPVDEVPVAGKLSLLRRCCERLDRPDIKNWAGSWQDQYRDRRFVSSLGADVRHDFQEAGVQLSFSIASGDETLQERFRWAVHRYSDIPSDGSELLAAIDSKLDKCARFVADAVSVQPGQYPVVLSPEVAGVFAHESFGHKSEADFMLGDPAMLEEWKLGTRIGPDMLNIVDDGGQLGSGWAPFDDEGQASHKTYLIKDGLLAGRLHASHTAVALDEQCTGNARAISFRFEPIVRMTTTWIEAGDLSEEALFAGVEDGYFIESYKHGSGMSTFTIAPSLAWRIRDGKVAEPVRIAVISGSVFETMGEIDGLSDTIERPFLLGGGCGKFEQWPLSVGFGGPFVRVRRMTVS